MMDLNDLKIITNITMNATGWYLIVVYLMHILLITPVMIYASSNKCNDHVRKFLGYMGWTGLIYHSIALAYSLFSGSWSWNWSL